MQNKLMGIRLDYTSALDLLYKHIGIPLRQREIGVSDILSGILIPFFGPHGIETMESVTVLNNTLEYYGLDGFETNTIGNDVTDCILEVTRMWLPGFNPSNPMHYISLDRIHFSGTAGVVIYLTMEQFNEFTHGRTTGIYEYHSSSI